MLDFYRLVFVWNGERMTAAIQANSLEEAISIAARNATTFKMISAEGRLGKVKWCDPYEEDYEV